MLPLLLGPEVQDGADAEPDGGLQRDAQGLVDPPDLLDRDAQAGETALPAAVLLGGGHAEQAELAHLVHDLDGEVVLAVPLRGVRRDLGLGELADDLAERLVLGRQFEGHRPGLRRSDGLLLRKRKRFGHPRQCSWFDHVRQGCPCRTRPADLVR